MMELNKILQGDALSVLRTLPSELVDCVVTSPPYWALRDYGNTTEIIWGDAINCEHEWGAKQIHKTDLQAGNPEFKRLWREKASALSDSAFCQKCGAWKGQLGLEPDFNLYIKHLCNIFDEVKRVLKKTGTCWVNLGDTFSGAGSGQKDTGKAVYEGSDFRKNPTKTFLPDKSLCNIPARFSIEMQNRGWILRNVIIWHKPNCMPSSVKDRFTLDFEYLFFFVKNKHYFFEPQFEAVKAETLERYKHPFKCLTGNFTSLQRGENITEKIKLNVGNGRNKRCVWSINSQPFSGAHFAVFPEELIETPIKAGCPKDGLVLDPFMGSGTTAVVSKRLGRNWLGIDLNPKYIELAEARLKGADSEVLKALDNPSQKKLKFGL